MIGKNGDLTPFLGEVWKVEGKTQFPTLLTSSILSREDSPDTENLD